jgi:hypothetical protein
MNLIHPTNICSHFNNVKCYDSIEYKQLFDGIGIGKDNAHIVDLYTRFLVLFFNKEEEWDMELYKLFNNDKEDRLSSMTEVECMVDYLINIFKNDNDRIKYIFSDENNWFTPKLKSFWGKYLTHSLVYRIRKYLCVNFKLFDFGNKHNHNDLSIYHKNDIINSLRTFYNRHPNFDSKKYRIYNNLKIPEIQAIEHWMKNKCCNDYLNGNYNHEINKIIIIPHNARDPSDGGNTVMYTLCKLLDSYGECVRIERVPQFRTDMTLKNHKKWSVLSKIHTFRNEICNHFAHRPENLWKNERKTTLVIYSEGINGNPIRAIHIVRWMLSELGHNVPKDRVNKWGKNELVYFFNREKRFYDEPEKVGITYKELSLLTIPHFIWSIPINKKNDWCHTIRKGYAHRNKDVKLVHPDNSYELFQGKHFLNDYLMIFSTHRYFISYDPLTFYSILCLLLDCVSIIIPLENKTKEEWLQMTAIHEYIQDNNNEPLYGVAYGMDEIEEAKRTLPLAREQWKRILKYYYDKHIPSFINDINNISKQQNLIKNIW